MSRKPHRLQWTEAACYHVINRGHNRETVLGDDDDRRKFLELLGRYRQRFDLLNEVPKEKAIAGQDWLVGEAQFRRESRDHRSRPAGRTQGRPRQEGHGALLS